MDGGFTEATNYAEGVATANTTIQIKPPTFDGFTVQQEAELDSENLLPEEQAAEPVQGSGKYGEQITAAPKEIDGYACTTKGEKTMLLGSNDAENRIVFFYVLRSYAVQYRVWPHGGGALSQTSEVATKQFQGSVPTENDGFSFAGWYLDEECTTPVGKLHDVDARTYKLTPDLNHLQPQPQTNVFYAKFVPACGSITIVREQTKDESNGKQTYVYQVVSKLNADLVFYVTITGAGKEKVTGLPVGEYIVTQQNDWSWRYADAAQTVTVSKNADVVLRFDGLPVSSSWLNGNAVPLQNGRQKE